MVELQHNTIAPARAGGVNHIVKVSAFAASDHSKAPIGRWHYEVENELEESGLGWTLLWRAANTPWVPVPARDRFCALRTYTGFQLVFP